MRKKVFPPVKWAVPGFLPEGLSIFAGGPKVGKSILALHLSVGVAISGCVLGNIYIKKGQVLYLALEDTERRLQDRINCGELAGNEDTDLSALDIVTEIPRQNIGGTTFIQYCFLLTLTQDLSSLTLCKCSKSSLLVRVVCTLKIMKLSAP